MIQSPELAFDASEHVVLSGIDGLLREQGWAKHVTVDQLLQDWRKLSESVARYGSTIDDYTDDLTGRDALEFVLANCDGPVRIKLEDHIKRSDKLFLVGTKEDTGASLGRFYRIDASSGWWWQRKPAAGTLANYLG